MVFVDRNTPKNIKLLDKISYYVYCSLKLYYNNCRFTVRVTYLVLNSRLCELRIDYLIEDALGGVRNGDQKVWKYLFPEMFYGSQEIHKY